MRHVLSLSIVAIFYIAGFSQIVKADVLKENSYKFTTQIEMNEAIHANLNNSRNLFEIIHRAYQKCLLRYGITEIDTLRRYYPHNTVLEAAHGYSLYIETCTPSKWKFYPKSKIPASIMGLEGKDKNINAFGSKIRGIHTLRDAFNKDPNDPGITLEYTSAREDIFRGLLMLKIPTPSFYSFMTARYKQDLICIGQQLKRYPNWKPLYEEYAKTQALMIGYINLIDHNSVKYMKSMKMIYLLFQQIHNLSTTWYDIDIANEMSIVDDITGHPLQALRNLKFVISNIPKLLPDRRYVIMPTKQNGIQLARLEKNVANAHSETKVH